MNNLKVRLVNKNTYPAVRAEIVDGRFEFDFEDMTCEEIQSIFSDKSNTAIIELLTLNDDVYGVHPAWTVYGGVTLNGNIKTLILCHESNSLQERIISAEAKVIEVKETIEDLKEKGMPFKNNKVLNASVMISRMSAQSLNDEQSLKVKDIYSEWKELVFDGYVATEPGYKFTHEGNLYKTINANQRFQAEWVPEAGTESIFTRIDEVYTGTLDDPIPASYNMKYTKGKYYLENGNIYLMNRAGMEDGESVVLQFIPSELLGQYFILAQ